MLTWGVGALWGVVLGAYFFHVFIWDQVFEIQGIISSGFISGGFS